MSPASFLAASASIQLPGVDVDVVAPAATGAEITLALWLYIAAWAITLALALWAGWRMLRTREKDGSPSLFWYLRQIPKVETLFALGALLWLATGMVVIWKIAQDRFGHFDSWMWGLAGLVGLAGTIYGVQRKTWNAEAARAGSPAAGDAAVGDAAIGGAG